MAEAIGLIVDTYVKLGSRKALEDLKVHRRRLATKLKSINTMLDHSSLINEIEYDIEVIEAGLAKLDAPVWARALGLGFHSRAP
jgi:hypothetical protein